MIINYNIKKNNGKVEEDVNNGMRMGKAGTGALHKILWSKELKTEKTHLLKYHVRYGTG